MTVSECPGDLVKHWNETGPLSYPAVPQQLLSKIDHIISLAEKNDISTAKVSALLELLSSAYEYGCSVSQDRCSLHEASLKALENCDLAFKGFVSSRRMEEEDQAKKDLESCGHFAGGSDKYTLDKQNYNWQA